jgi:hypothetical protein
MMLPGPAMLFLAASLQPLPRQTIVSVLQKIVQYAYADRDLFGRTIALIARSHLDVALEFTNTFIANSLTKRRVLFVFRSAELNENAVGVVFRINA